MWVLVDVSDIMAMTVIADEEGRTMLFESQSEADDYGERMCSDTVSVEVPV